MHMTRRLLLGVSAAGAALAMTGCGQSSGNASAELTAFLDRLSTEILRQAPEYATMLAVSEEQAGGRYIDRLSDVSRENFIRQRGLAETALADLGRINRDQLQGQEVISYDIAQTSLQDAIDATRFEFGGGAGSPYIVTQLTGAYRNIPDFLDTRHPLTTRDQTDAYFTRLSAYATMLDQETAVINTDAAAGMIPPTFAIQGGITGLHAAMAGRPADNVLVTTLVRRLPEVAEIPEAERAGLVTRAETVVRDEIFPAYQRQIDALTALLPRSTADAGVGSRPQGAELYAVALRGATTTSMTPDEVHNIGLELITQLNAESDAILRANGMTNGTVAQRVAQIKNRPGQIYPNNDAGRTQLLADLNVQVQAIQARMGEQFTHLAQAPLEIRRVPAAIEAGSPGGYYQPAALDGSQPGSYYINLRDTAEWPKFKLPTLSYHEGVPGHHWQISIQQEAGELPFYRKALSFFSAFSEGWGLYSEQLADEMGVYANDPWGRLGYLQSMTFRASRLVCDTGLHAKGWTREQAIDSMMQATGDSRTAVTTEIERYCVWPGQACSYMVGRQAINRMRDSARTTLGDRYDQKAFHDTLLTNGATPLSVSETLVNQWVASVQAPA
jgi:uncharacterized protein (DUF885 family)